MYINKKCNIFSFLLFILTFNGCAASIYLGAYGGRISSTDTIKEQIIINSLSVEKKIDYSKEYKFGIMVGYKWSIARAELEIAREKANIKQSIFEKLTQVKFGSRKSYLAFANGYLFLPGIVRPYLGVGAGYVTQDINISNLINRKAFGYQFMFGISAGISILEAFFDYRYLHLSNNGITDQESGRHSANLGLIIKIT